MKQHVDSYEATRDNVDLLVDVFAQDVKAVIAAASRPSWCKKDRIEAELLSVP